MSHPLGPRYVRPAARAKKIRLKPPTDTYFVNVAIPPHVAEEDEPGPGFNDRSSYAYESSFSGSRRGSGGLSPAGSAFSFASSAQRVNAEYSASAANAMIVHLNIHDGVQSAIAKICARFREVHERDLPRPPEAYMLCRCFADYSIDFSLRGLHGDSPTPLVEVLEFPYYLSLQVIPYQQRRDVLVFELEPQRRQRLREERRTFVLFALEYAAMLRRMHQQYHFLLGRDADARRAKRIQEMQARHDVQMRIAFKSEREDRAAIAADEAVAWERTAFVTSALMEHCAVLDDMFRYSERELGAAHRRVLKHLASLDRLAVLNHRLQQLFTVTLPRVMDAALQQHRDAYTEARLSSEMRTAQIRELETELVHEARVREGRRGHPDLYGKPDVVNSLVVLGDVYTSARSLI